MHYITRIRPPPPSPPPPPPPRARRMRLHEQRCGAARSRSSETHLRINSYLIGALRRARVGSSISPGNPGRSLVCTASVERGHFHPIAMDRGILTLFARGRIVRSMAATTVGRKSLRRCVCVCVVRLGICILKRRWNVTQARFTFLEIAGNAYRARRSRCVL